MAWGGCLAPTSGETTLHVHLIVRMPMLCMTTDDPGTPPPQGFRGEAASPPLQCHGSTLPSRWKQEGGRDSRNK